MATPTPSEQDAIATMTPAQAEKARAEIAQRPQVLPLDKRAYPSGAPEWLLKKRQQEQKQN